MTDDPTRPPTSTPAPTRPLPQRFEIRLAGRLDPRWSTWLDGLEPRSCPDGTTALRGPIADQAALHGLLARIRDLGIPLLAVTPLDDEPTSAPPPTP
jgi:hypothetical protein